MKGKVSPAVMVIAVVAAIVLILIVGVKIFGPEGSGNNVEEYRKKYAPNAPPGPLVQQGDARDARPARPVPPGAPAGYKPPP